MYIHKNYYLSHTLKRLNHVETESPLTAFKSDGEGR